MGELWAWLDAGKNGAPELRREIEGGIARGGPADGCAIPRKNVFWGAWVKHGRLYPDYQRRLFRRGRGRFVERAVHESVEIQGSVGRLEAPLLHHSYRSLEEFIQRSNRYSTLAAGGWVRQGRHVSPVDFLIRPLGRFLSMYLLHRGFLDGWRGLLLAGLYAHYVFLRTAKVWEMRHAR